MTAEKAIVLIECSANELKETLKETTMPSSAAEQIQRYIDAYEMAISALRQQEQERNPKWISVNDRLPEAGVTVLARCFYHECWQTIVCYVSRRNIGQWYTKVAGQWVQVTHWMPLPEPPEEDDHANL